MVWIILQVWVLPRFGGEDLNERNLRAEFGSCEGAKDQKNIQAINKRRKEIAMTVMTINPRQLADLCKSGKIELIDVADTQSNIGRFTSNSPGTCRWTNSMRRR